MEKSKIKGVTLVEILIVLVIMAIIATVMLGPKRTVVPDDVEITTVTASAYPKLISKMRLNEECTYYYYQVHKFSEVRYLKCKVFGGNTTFIPVD